MFAAIDKWLSSLFDNQIKFDTFFQLSIENATHAFYNWTRTACADDEYPDHIHWSGMGEGAADGESESCVSRNTYGYDNSDQVHSCSVLAQTTHTLHTRNRTTTPSLSRPACTHPHPHPHTRPNPLPSPPPPP